MTIAAILSHTTAMAFINAGLSFMLTSLVVYVLFGYASIYNLVERIGYGWAGAAIFISGFKQLGFAYLVAPFEPTYQMLWRLGWALILGGLIYRLRKHKIANDRQKAAAKRHFAGRPGAAG